MTREQLQKQFSEAFQKLSPSERERYPISVTDLITDLWPHLGWEDKQLIRFVVGNFSPMPCDFPDDF